MRSKCRTCIRCFDRNYIARYRSLAIPFPSKLLV
nr:MAG TPA: hypothetical protein [Caudoviricetes sp.]